MAEEEKEDAKVHAQHNAAGTPHADRPKRRKTVSPGSMSKEEKSEMLEKYKIGELMNFFSSSY